MKRWIEVPIVIGCLWIVLSCSPIIAAPPPEYLGSWSNVTSENVDTVAEPQMEGFFLELWKTQGKLTGYLQEYIGMPGSTVPIGKLDRVTFNEKSGLLSFDVKMSLYGPKTKTLYHFSGILKGDQITGALEELEVGTKKSQGKKEVVLEGASSRQYYIDFKTYEEWEQSYAEKMKLRGPTW